MTTSIHVFLFGLFPFLMAFPHQFGPTLESCQDKGVNFDHYYTLDREGVTLKCPSLKDLRTQESINTTEKYSIMWYQYKTSEVITRDKKQRIYVEDDSLWFLPVLIEDADHYICVVRNSTFCIKEAVSLTVSNSTSASCPQNEAFFVMTSYSETSKMIYCPDIHDYVDSNENFALRWYKNCEPISFSGLKYSYHKSDWYLIVRNVEPSDAGMYVCELRFMRNGLQYTTSRTIDFYIKGCKASVGPQITHPKNGTIEIPPGSNLNLSCIAYIGFCKPPLTVMHWLVNNEFIEDHFNDTFQVEQSQRNEAQGNYHQMNIIFTNFKEEYYKKKFTCVAKNGLGYQTATIIFKKAAADFTKEIATTFGVFACVLFICICTYKIFKIDIVLCLRDTFPATGAENACAEQVKTNIKESRRLIILMAKSFDKQLFEQQVGLHDALFCDQMKVILIELEYHEDYTNFSQSIQHIIQKKGTIKWKENESTTKSSSSNSKFWKQVRYNMPPKSSRS
ncbi:interleukin-1 receptor type 1-like isoform X2 [Narcine bancroftii]|uniref:interleukin-1 receptor type 1-like isoform X2 n=1 Tax=Narcine bancroftii TaxID=1343680 RepID=UPI0038315B8F